MAVHSLWPSAEPGRSSCTAPPAADDPLGGAAATGRLSDPPHWSGAPTTFIEAEYQQWLRDGGHRKHWLYF